MKLANFSGKFQLSANVGMVVRIGLASFAILGSLVLAWSVLNNQIHAHAAGITRTSTTSSPWGLALDTANGHIWVAEPACNASPICGTPPPGTIGEYNLSNGSKVNEFTATGSYNPVFLALDASGNVWFTDPTHNAIGELVPGNNTWTEYTAPTANSAPYDLVFSGGNIWFTEFKSNNIGFFDTTKHQFVENAIPTASANPYGITIAPNGNIWFTENNLAQIGTFTPTSSGTLAAAAITEHAIKNKGPHLITADSKGNIWFSEGFDGQIGEYTTTGTNNEYPVSTGVCPQATPSTTPPACSGTHISGIGVDSNGMVWFDDSLSNRVGFLNPSNSTFTAISVVNPPNDTNPHPHDGLVVDGNNNVWVSEQNGFNLDEIQAGNVVASPTASPSVSPTASPTVSPTPVTPPPGPTAKKWYFAEGRIGKGFREYLTIDNPSATDCSVDIQYLYKPENGSPATRTVTVAVPATSRFTKQLKDDLGLDYNSPTADDVSSIVSVSSGSSCPGIVVERPLYFVNYHGISSGNDVLGATTLSKTSYFADIPTGANNTSYLSILNPAGGADATVTVNYYLGGQQVATQSIPVAAGSRGTIAPGALNNPALPAHVAAVVTSNTPVMVERPTYFTHASLGTSGGYDVVGAQAPANDWLFAEGYASDTGNIFQEYLTISNIDARTIPAQVAITLKSQNGSTATYPVTVNANDQLIWDVNAHDTFNGATAEVSAEVTSAGASIVVQRELYFQYHHSIKGGTSLQARGGTDVMGMLGPISKSSYSFAEGYTNTGYHEWLTLQNPNPTAETITITLVNGLGHSSVQNVPVKPNSRQTVDITQMVELNLAKPGPSQSDQKANAISMTVQTLNNGGTFVAERPEYLNTAGTSSTLITQGGSDIIGYVGG